MVKSKASLITGLGCICAALIMVVLTVSGCGYYLIPGRLWPLPESDQEARTRISDDGTVTFVRERLEIGVRPMTDEELNREFSGSSQTGFFSTNPYTYANWIDPGTGQPPKRFEVFKLKVNNYTYPKVKVDPMKALIIADNGHRYSPLSMLQLEEYYRPHVIGYNGNDYERCEKRKDILRRTLHRPEVLFSGQEEEGYIVFPKLHPAVKEITFILRDVGIRFDVSGEVTQSIEPKMLFRRDIKHVKYLK